LLWDRLEQRTLLNAADLDPTFGTGGSVTTGFPYDHAPTQARSVVIDSQGRAVVAGVVNDAPGNNVVVLARYITDGSPDTSFGNGGVVYTPISAGGGGFGGPEAAPIALDSTGRILVAGSYVWPPVYGPFGFDIGPASDFAVVRLEPDGTMDTSFGTGGMVTIDIGATDPNTGLPIHTYDSASGVAIQSDGEIVVSGTTIVPPSNPNGYSDDNFAVTRLNPDGSIDTSFGTNGRSSANFPVVNPSPYFTSTSYDTATSLALAPDGKIVVEGSTLSDFLNEFDDFAVARFNTDGSLDSSFGTGGLVYQDLNQANPGTIDDAYALLVQTDGKIVLGGEQGPNPYGNPSPGPNWALLRLNLDGTNDSSFGTNGLVLTPVPNMPQTDALSGIALQSDSRIVAVGFNQVTNFTGGNFINSNDVVLARYNTDGSLDTSFGSGGMVEVNPPVDHLSGYAVALQSSDGKIVVVGQDFTDPPFHAGFLVQRYNTDGSTDASYGSGGQTTTNFDGARNEPNVVKPLVLPDGKIVVAGSTSMSLDPQCCPAGGEDFGLVEYNHDGSLNTSFGTGGRVTTGFGFSPDLNTVSGISLVTIDGTPKILVTGSVVDIVTTPNSATYVYNFGLARYNLDGTLDTSFGTGGEVVINVGYNGTNDPNLPYLEGVGGMTVQSDGKIVVVGTIYVSGQAGVFKDDFGVVRVNPDGSLDSSFGNGGIVTTDMSPSGNPGTVPSFASTVAIQPNGKIVVGGEANFGDFALARYDRNGNLDRSFGTDGKVVQQDPSGFFFSGIVDMALQPDGKIVAVGSDSKNSLDFAVVRFTKQGNLDSSFGNGGIVTTDLTPSDSTSGSLNQDTATGVVLQPDGKIIVAGWTTNPGSYIDGSGFTPPMPALTRYNTDGSLDPTFGTGGVSIESALSINPYQRVAGVNIPQTSPAIDADGKILLPYPALGSAGQGTRFGLARFLGMDLAIAGPSAGTRGQRLTFTGSFDGQSTDVLSAVTWKFGDGTGLGVHGKFVNSGLTVTHVYRRPGTYTITLTVEFLGGATLTTSQQVTITSDAAAADTAGPGPAGSAVGRILDEAITSLVDGGVLNVSPVLRHEAVPEPSAPGVLSSGATRDRFYLDLARELLLDPLPGPKGVNITDETPMARAKRLSHF
jgi:uncharacterized delta-60 repeat protein